MTDAPPSDMGTGNGSAMAYPPPERVKNAWKDTDLTIVESSTRYWLSAQVLIACVLMGLFALSIRDSRQSVEDFPVSFNYSCTSAVYTVQMSLQNTLVDVIEDSQNFTNQEFQSAVQDGAFILHTGLESIIKLFLAILGEIAPSIECGINGGLSLANSVENAIQNAASTQISCNTNPPCNTDPVPEFISDVNNILQTIQAEVDSWPKIPSNLAGAINLGLAYTNLFQTIAQLENFSATGIVNVNATQIVMNALGNSIDYASVNETCGSVTVQFQQATNETALIMYYIEIVIWLCVALLIVGIFVYSIIRQFPTAVTKKISDRYESFTDNLQYKFQQMEDTATSRNKQYLVWFLKYTNFKLALMSTLYGVLGLICVYSLSKFTDLASNEINIWIDASLTPGMTDIADKIQDGINGAFIDIEDVLNNELDALTDQQISVINGTITTLKNFQTEYWQEVYIVMSALGNVPGIGPELEEALVCWLPLNTTDEIIAAADSLFDFMIDILTIRIHVPTFTFPVGVMTAAGTITHITIQYVITKVQNEMYKYQVIFIFLCIAIGILVFQGLIFLGMKKSADIIKERMAR